MNKEIIHKLINTYKGPDFYLGREFLCKHYPEFVKSKARQKEFDGKKFWVISIDELGEFLGKPITKEGQSSGWSGIVIENEHML